MKKIVKLLFACTLITLISFSKAEVKEKDEDQIDIHEETLDNGLKIIVVPLKSNGAVFAGVGYHVGSGDDPRDTIGISHFLEHMMFKGTKNISGEKLKETIGKYNKFKNAFTGYDLTFFMYSCNKVFLDIDLKIEADRMQNLSLKNDDIEKEKEVIIEERKMSLESDPRTKYMVESAFKSMFLYSNYSYPIIGYLDQIKNCDKKSIKKHYDKFYKPNNAFVLIVGDITKDEAASKVKKYFSSIKKGEDISRNRVIDPTEDTGLTYSIDHASKQISSYDLDLVYKVDRTLFDNMKKYITVEMVTNILGSGCSSILYENIVDKKELSYTIDSQLDIRAYDKGQFSIATIFRENTKAEVVENEIISIINNYTEKYLTEELLQKEKKKMLDKIDLMKDNPQSMFTFILENEGNNRNTKQIKDIKNIINSIKLDDLKETAKKIFTKENRFMKIYSHPKGN